MFCLDIETLGTESNAVVLSAALLYFDQTKTYQFQELIDSACFVKFDAKEQVSKYKRLVEKSTVEWWQKQDKEVQKLSLAPRETDVTAEKGIRVLQQYIRDHSTEKKEVCWIRGTLDQVCMDSLCKSVELPFLFDYYQYRDVRTALDLIKETTKRGYCRIPNFDLKQVNKHDPVHDVALDAMMLMYGE